jgi:hypothetical protein
MDSWWPESRGDDAQAIDWETVGTSGSGVTKKKDTRFREAVVEILSFEEAERHLVMVSPLDAARCHFQEKPGPGPQFG